MGSIHSMSSTGWNTSHITSWFPCMGLQQKIQLHYNKTSLWMYCKFLLFTGWQPLWLIYMEQFSPTKNWLFYFTWDNLQKRGRSGPGICVLCKSEEETVVHLFNNCIVWQTVLGIICEQFQIPAPSRVDSPTSFVRNWAGNYVNNPTLLSIPFHMLWIIWKARNRAIFEGKKRNVHSIVQQISYHVQTYSSLPDKVKKLRKIGDPPCMYFPCVFFDGASVNKSAGVG